ncbi:nucleotide sugar dehydrogenase [Zavarzinella formosa]|uniref:nucleotide sugar dehydrogenase n=1 Tax=Zavarzinella formosa TaxID=360055 RepID=UPI00030578E3|nr:nucleotide sugar dehydrogenase [Zavarzinella formosa]
MSKHWNALEARIREKRATVGIIGLGYVGLPLARAFATAGFHVIGFDLDPMKVQKLNRGESYIRQIPASDIVAMRENRFEATDRFDRLDEADAILVCVPTPLTDAREPDLSYVVNSTHAIAGQLRAGQLIVLESTTYPGTTRKVVLPILDRTDLKVGEDYFLAFSPEREDPGNHTFGLTSIPKVVGGHDAKTTDLAALLYQQIVPSVVKVSAPEVAEACKILENTYRAVNIALVNEMKILYDRMGIDVWEVIDAAKTKPFGFQAFYPGPGLGGHCIPIDPFYLTWVARQYGLSTRFIELAGEVNMSMPGYVAGKVADALNEHGKPVKGSKIAILGMAYKKDVDDPRESPGFELMDLLLNKGASVSYNDPHIPTLPKMRHWPHLKMSSSSLTTEYLAGQDCVLIATEHSAYDWGMIAKNSRLIVDTRNALKNIKEGREKIVRA